MSYLKIQKVDKRGRTVGIFAEIGDAVGRRMAREREMDTPNNAARREEERKLERGR